MRGFWNGCRLPKLVPMGGRVSAMIQAYLDETGIHEGSGVCAIAGYFGGPGQWKKQGGEWDAILKPYRVNEFHAKQFWGFDNEGRRVGPYKGWSNTKADAFLNELVCTIETRPKLHPISAAVVMNSWNKLSTTTDAFLPAANLWRENLRLADAPANPTSSLFSRVSWMPLVMRQLAERLTTFLI
jgi:hypothetical protein